MHPAVELLTGVMRPPLQGGDHIDWQAWYAEFGFDLPADFKEFMDVYGGGMIDQSLSVMALAAGDGWWRDENQSGDYEFLHDPLSGEELEQPLHWGIGGLIQWGGFGPEQCFWYANDPNPDSWPVVIWLPRRRVEWAHHREGFASFLNGLITGNIESPFSMKFPLLPEPDFMNWRDRERLRAIRVSPVSYGRDPRAVIARIEAAGLDPLDFFPSASRFL